MIAARKLAIHLIALVLIFIAALMSKYISIPCIFRELTSIPCPTCGLTRSVRALVTGSLRLSLYYHPLTMLFAGLLLLALHRRRLRISKRAFDLILIACSMIVFIVYIYRLYYDLIP
ncbi:MAG TPA: DUF2752 domain-containing protein [Candidatus Atribacteria bacterium]|nr:DUF2752 domain-containing protein [Candidatus Atribacteria bacterium]